MWFIAVASTKITFNYIKLYDEIDEFASLISNPLNLMFYEYIEWDTTHKNRILNVLILKGTHEMICYFLSYVDLLFKVKF